MTRTVCVFAVLAIALLTGCRNSDDNRVHPGQTWVYEPHKGNPFATPEVYHNTVIAVSNGWVLYERNGEVRSETIPWFLAGSTLISERAEP